jgi:anti-sigma factor RsiW
MNCKSVQKYLHAFADGQLGVRANCDVLDHLKMCPTCSRRVDEHQLLRKAIGKELRSTAVPAHLAARIQESLVAGSRPAIARPRSWRSAVIFVGAAAAILLSAVVYLRDFQPTANPVVEMPFAGSSVRGSAGAQFVAKVHRQCTARGKAHHNPALPGSLVEVESAVAAYFDNRLAVSFPDLSAYDYKFESANYCSPSEVGSVEGGHVVYASAAAGRVSFFVTPRSDQFEPIPGGDVTSDGPYRQFEVPAASGSRTLSVLAWNRGATSFVCCGDVDINKLRLMVGAIRTVQADFDERLLVAFASMKSVESSLPASHTH